MLVGMNVKVGSANGVADACGIGVSEEMTLITGISVGDFPTQAESNKLVNIKEINL